MSIDLATSRPVTGPRLPADALDALFRQPRTARRWADAPVGDDVLEQVYDLLRWGPTAMNTTPLRVLAVRSPEARERRAAHVDEGNRERVRTAPLSLVVAADAEFHEHLPVLAPHMAGMRDRLAEVPEVRERLARDNAWLQTGYLVAALRAVGLDVGPMTGMDAAAIDADLLAGTSWRTMLVVNVGWPGADGGYYPRAPRLAYEQAVRVV